MKCFTKKILKEKQNDFMQLLMKFNKYEILIIIKWTKSLAMFVHPNLQPKRDKISTLLRKETTTKSIAVSLYLVLYDL